MRSNRLLYWLGLSALVLTAANTAFAQGTAFTYQGRLNDGASPATGTYEFEFRVFDSVSNGAGQVGNALTNAPTSVSNGLFTVTLDFGAGIFTGASRWLQIGVRTNNGGSFFPLTPRQALTAAPYAIMAGNVSGVISNSSLPVNPAFAGTIAAAAFAGNGANLSNVNASALNGLGSSNFWQVGGNKVSAGHFLGSTNYIPVEIRVNGARGLRIEPNDRGAANIIGGSQINAVDFPIAGATIAGGGATNSDGGFGPPKTNRISADFGSIGGGLGNAIRSGATYSVIAGGIDNLVSTNATAGFIGGGENNKIHSGAGFSVISGGGLNVIQPNATESVIAGGVSHSIGTNAHHSVIGGGSDNTINPGAEYSVIGGGVEHVILSNSVRSVIGGGGGNEIRGNLAYSTIAGGAFNEIEFGASYSSIGGGINNYIGTNASYATVGGGTLNTIGSSIATIGGGGANDIGTNSGSSTIGGGNNNDINANSRYSTIAGGGANGIGTNSSDSTVGGGFNNHVGANSAAATIAGGLQNDVGTNSNYSTIGGGERNTITGAYATIPGGDSNTATNYAFAAGREAKANHEGTFVWADSQAANFSSTANNQMIFRAAGGVGINTNQPGATLDVNGSLRVGFGTTVFSSLQGGVTQMTNTSSTARTNFTFTFPKPFATAPKVLLTARNEPAQANANDTFVVSVRNVTTTTCTVNITRVDTAAGWGQLVMVDWLAWE
jgi:hypothetical protein